MAIGAAVAVGASLVGGMMASSSAKDAAAKEQAFMEQAMSEFENVGIPSAEAMQYVLENPKMVFEYFPQMENQFPEIKTGFDAIEADPRLKDAQMSALSGLEERAEMGMTPEEQASLNKMRRETAGAEQAQQAGMVQSMEQRGLGGSGLEMASRLSSSQASTNRAAEESDRLAAMQFQAKQAALMNVGQLGGEMRSQDFGEQAQKASAADSIAQFNAQQRAGTQQRNIAAMNAAELEKQRLAQTLEGTRADTRNKEEIQRVAALTDKAQLDLSKASGLAGQYASSAELAGKSGATQAQATSDMWSGAGKVAGTAAQAYADSPTKLKEDEYDAGDYYQG